MQNRMSTTAGIAAHADGSRLHAGQGFAAYPWHVVGACRAGSFTQNTVVIADPSKLRFRWPQETSP